ncbi:hypothetical protein [Streptomyces scabiei]|uniref:hypothetical protein n=1 Tax=Streptomyces scabiei TaxID=1930 RepID=UPI000A382326|nr:hypothetical protein [Streptomyces scabiei]
MPAHKMVTIDGIRVRAEDEDRYRARTGAGAGPLTRALAEPAKSEEPVDADESAESDAPEEAVESEESEEPASQQLFDPSEHDAPSVLAHLATADETESARVLAAEAAGKNRKTIMGKEHSA